MLGESNEVHRSGIKFAEGSPSRMNYHEAGSRERGDDRICWKVSRNKFKYNTRTL